MNVDKGPNLSFQAASGPLFPLFLSINHLCLIINHKVIPQPSFQNDSLPNFRLAFAQAILYGII